MELDNLQCCPRLVVDFKDGRSPIDIYGPHNIYEYLQQKNKEIRSATVSKTLLSTYMCQES